MDSKIDLVLQRIEEQEKFEQENPHEIPNSEKVLAIGRNTGIFYNILLHTMKAKNILEIGLSTGYSTMWFADAISKTKGNIITIDFDQKKIKRAKKNFDDAKVDNFIEIRHGDALEVLSEISQEKNFQNFFDFVFIDADKERYIQYFDSVLPLVKTGGIIGADNILYPERFQKFTIPYVEHVRKNPKIKSVTIPIDNGEELSLKLQ
ncbi:MAG: methyltransferase domain-containing protein [Nitrosopumilaceae archaeon]|nr:methyltransferase domain-containing protein [Nitrosopumilaceae archaeon]